VSRRLGPYRLGQSIRVSCSVLGGNPSPSVTWWRESQVVDTSYQSTTEGGGSRVTNILTISSLTRADLHSILTCQASNSNSSLPVSTSVKLDLHFPPTSVTISGADRPLSAGKLHSITCTARGARPSPKINWYLGKKQINGLQTQLHSNESMTISYISLTPSPEQAGEVLKCMAKVPGLGHEDVKEDTKTLKVDYMGEATIHMSDEVVNQGEDVSVSCHVEAHPPPHQVVWEKDGEPVAQDAARVVVTNLTLVLRSVTREDHGEYRCRASNSLGSSASPPHLLTILHPPSCTSPHPSEVRVGLHQHTEVVCEVSALPSSPLTFRWVFRSTREEVDIPASQVTSLGLTSRVAYKPRTSLDYGTLLCWGENSVGVQEEPCRVHLLPTTTPSPPHNCSLTSLHLVCTAGDDGGLAQTFHLVATTSMGIIMANMSSSTPTFSIGGLSSGTSLMVSSSNSEGWSSSSPSLTLGGREVSSDPAQALPSLNTQGLRVTPLLGALIGIGGALGLLTFVILLLLLCRGKRSPTSSTFKMVDVDQDLKAPDLIPPAEESEEEWSTARRKDNVFIVDPVYQCASCPPYPSHSQRPYLPPSSYSTIHRADYASMRCSQACLPEESTLLLPPPSTLLLPPPSLSSGLGSSGSDLDNSRGTSEEGHSPRLQGESEV